MSSSCILFVTRSETAFRELFRVAELLKRSNRYEPIFYFYEAPRSIERIRRVCDEAMIGYCFPHRKPISGFRKRLEGYLDYIFRRILPQTIYEVYSLIKAKMSLLDIDRRTLYQTNPTLLVVPEDGLGGDLEIMRLARNKGIPIIVIPYEYSTKIQILGSIKSSPDYLKTHGTTIPLNRLAGYLFPHWVFVSDGEKLLREKASTILALEIMRLAPRDPWTVHGGYADYLAVESEKMMEHYLRERIPGKKLVLTGSLGDDDLYKVLSDKMFYKNEFCRALGLPEGNRLILSAIPTDYTSRSGCEFPDYERLIDFWVGTLLSVKNVNVVIELHPAVTSEQEKYIRGKGANISTKNIASLIPLCDLLVTSVSSIIRMAIACQIPVLNYDVFQFGYPDYAEEKGVLTVRTKANFDRTYNDLLRNSEFYQQITTYQIQSASQWGRLDGKAGERQVELIDKLCSSHLVDPIQWKRSS